MMTMETRLHAEAEQRTREARQAYRDYVAARNGDRIARGGVRPEPNYPAALVIIAAAGMVGALAVLVVPPILNALFGLLTGWMG